MRKAEEEELARPLWEQGQKSNGTLPETAERQPLRAATGTWLEAGTTPDKGIWSGEMPEGLPFPLGYSTSKSHWVLILDAWHPLSKGSLEQQHPALGTCSPGLA